MRVALIEDDPTISVPLADGLRRAGFEVEVAVNAAGGLDIAGAADLVLLDLGLPDLDGSEVCRRIRETSTVPIIVVSARGEEIDRVMLLESGADDYLVKPFGTRELIARIRAVSRRTGARSSREAEVEETTRTIGALVIDLAAHRVSLDHVELDLTPKEFDLLVHLSGETGVIHRRRDILESVWDEHWYGPTKTLDVHIAALRRKLGDPAWIETVRGVGYRFGPPS
jgi:two-component system response regulator RegX3